MDLSAERWKVISKILDKVLDKPKSERLAYLKSLCNDDSDLLHDVTELLDFEEHIPKIIDSPIRHLHLIKELRQPVIKNKVKKLKINQNSQRIGPYQTLEIIGVGGMGTVYRGKKIEQDIEHIVAIKVLTADPNKAQVTQRFKLEQQFLASLVHPNIAQLYDGGVTESGQPYFVMEYVKGIPIDEYADQFKLNIDERIELLNQVASALAYAHKKLIVHRDIKPSNILVNDQRQVKLLDFGIAKLLDKDKSNITQTINQLMTPGYASPEQILNQPVSVQTDIYLLGLVIYKVLTGLPAYQYENQSFLEIANKICTQEPTAPSIKISKESKLNRSEFANQRSNEIGQIIKKLSGDIDAIVLKTLQYKPEERYESIQELKSDFVAYFENRPVLAKPISITYRLSKFIRRRWWFFVTSTTFLLSLVIYATTITYQSYQIKKALIQNQHEKLKAQQATKFLVRLFETADPNISKGKSLGPTALLEKGHKNIKNNLNDVPQVQGQLYTQLGRIYFSLGAFDKSVDSLESSLQIQRALLLSEAGKDELRYIMSDLANTLAQLGVAYSRTRKRAEAKLLVQESLDTYDNLRKIYNTPETAEYAEALSIYAQILNMGKNYDVAISYFQKSIDILSRLDNSNPSELAVALNGLANAQYAMGKFESAIDSVSLAIEQHKKYLGENHSYLSIYLVNYAKMLAYLEKFNEANEVSLQALAIQEKILPNDHSYFAASYRILGSIAYSHGDLVKAAEYLKNGLRIYSKNSSKNYYLTPQTHIKLSSVLRDQGYFTESEQHIETAKALLAKNASNTHHLAQNRLLLGYVDLAKGEYLDANEKFEDSLEYISGDKILESEILIGIAYAKYLSGEFQQSRLMAQRALETRIKKNPPFHSFVAEARALYGLSVIQMEPSNTDAISMIRDAEKVLTSRALYNIGYRSTLLRAINRI